MGSAMILKARGSLTGATKCLEILHDTFETTTELLVLPCIREAPRTSIGKAWRPLQRSIAKTPSPATTSHLPRGQHPAQLCKRLYYSFSF